MVAMWVYKNNALIGHSERSERDFEAFFDYADGKPLEWGVLGVTMDERANRAAFERMKKGDWVICYQVDRHAILGIAKVHSIDRATSAQPELVLRPDRRLKDPINVPKRKKADPAFAKVRAFAIGSYATLQDVSVGEEPALRSACGLP